MKEIPLTKGYVALVDDEDYPYLSQFKWCAKVEKYGYVSAVRKAKMVSGKSRLLYMHRVIMDAPLGIDVDHRDGCALNNQRFNLRVCSRMENARNRGKSKNNTSGFCGVSKHGSGFQAMIGVNRKRIHLGTYPTPEEAAQAYDFGAIKYHGEFAKLNFPNKEITHT